MGEGREIHVDDTRLVYCFVLVQMQTQILKRSVSDPVVLHPMYFPLLPIKISPAQLLKSLSIKMAVLSISGEQNNEITKDPPPTPAAIYKPNTRL